MGRIIRLTESDLTRIVRRVIMEQEPTYGQNITKNVKIKPGASYTVNYNHMAYKVDPKGPYKEATSYAKIPQGTVFTINDSKKVAFATIQQGTQWTTVDGEFPKKKDGTEVPYSYSAIDVKLMGPMFSKLKTTALKVSYDYGTESLVSDSDQQWIISRDLAYYLDKNLFNMG